MSSELSIEGYVAYPNQLQTEKRRRISREFKAKQHDVHFHEDEVKDFKSCERNVCSLKGMSRGVDGCTLCQKMSLRGHSFDRSSVLLHAAPCGSLNLGRREERQWQHLLPRTRRVMSRPVYSPSRIFALSLQLELLGMRKGV
jgi:hypothetical protein